MDWAFCSGQAEQHPPAIPSLAEQQAAAGFVALLRALAAQQSSTGADHGAQQVEAAIAVSEVWGGYLNCRLRKHTFPVHSN